MHAAETRKTVDKEFLKRLPMVMFNLLSGKPVNLSLLDSRFTSSNDWSFLNYSKCTKYLVMWFHSKGNYGALWEQ